LGETFGNFWYVSEFNEVLRLEDVDYSVPFDLPDHRLDTVQGWVRSPVVVNLFQRYRIEYNAGHYFAQNGAVSDEAVVVGGRLLVDHRLDPLQNSLFEVQVSLGFEHSVLGQR